MWLALELLGFSLEISLGRTATEEDGDEIEHSGGFDAIVLDAEPQDEDVSMPTRLGF